MSEENNNNFVWALIHQGPYDGYKVVKVLNREPNHDDELEYIENMKVLNKKISLKWDQCKCRGKSCTRANDPDNHYQCAGIGYLRWEKWQVTA